MVCNYYKYLLFLSTIFCIKTGVAHLLPGGGIKDGVSTSISNNSSRGNKFKKMMCNTLQDMNDKAIANIKSIVEGFQTTMTTKDVATDVNNTLTAIEKLEGRKRKLELEVTTMNDCTAKEKKVEID